MEPDITKLRGPHQGSWFHLYVILDIYSRYVTGQMVASRESAHLAEVLIRQTAARQGIRRDQLTIHADRGSSMTSKPVTCLLAGLAITQSHSRPHISDDNSFSEAQLALAGDAADVVVNLFRENAPATAVFHRPHLPGQHQMLSLGQPVAEHLSHLSSGVPLGAFAGPLPRLWVGGREAEQDRRHGEGRMFSGSRPVPGAAANSLRAAAR